MTAFATALAVTLTVPLFTMLRFSVVPPAIWPTPTAAAVALAAVPPVAFAEAATLIVPLLSTLSVTTVPLPPCDTPRPKATALAKVPAFAFATALTSSSPLLFTVRLTGPTLVRLVAVAVGMSVV